MQAIVKADIRSVKERLRALVSAVRPTSRTYGSAGDGSNLDCGECQFVTHRIEHFDFSDNEPDVNEEDVEDKKEEKQRDDWLTSESSVAKVVDATECETARPKVTTQRRSQAEKNLLRGASHQ